MSKKTSKAAAARARAACWSKSHQVHPSRLSPHPAKTEQHHHEMLPAKFPPIELDFDDGLDCGYTGGVNYVPSDMDEDTNKSLIHPDKQSTDCESIQELEGDELEANLARLQDSEKGSLQAPTLLDKISEPKKPLDWKRAEKKRGLGYNGHSKRTQCRRDKEGQDGKRIREEAKVS